LAILFGILVSFYFLGNVLSSMKMDLTEDKIFTISPATKEILQDLQDDVLVRYYCSENVPSALINLKRDTIDTFRELEALADGKLKWEVVAPEVAAREYAAEQVKEYYKALKNNETPKEPKPRQTIQDIMFRRSQPTDEDIKKQREQEARTLAEKTDTSYDDRYRQLLSGEFEDVYLQDLESKGITRVPMQERTGTQTTQTVFFTAIEIKYLDKQPEVIPLYHRIEDLEYDLANKILKLTQQVKPKVAFFDSRKPEMPPFNPMQPQQRPPASDYGGVINALRDLFDIEEITLKENDSISDLRKRLKEDREKEKDEMERAAKPKDISCLVVAQPNDLEPRQVFEISKAVSEGIPAIFLVSSYSIDFSQAGAQQGFPITTLRPSLDDLFRSWGITLGREIIASSESCAAIRIEQRDPRLPIAVSRFFTLPVLLQAGTESINQSHPLTNSINNLVFPAAVGLTVNEDDTKKAELKVTELANSGDKAYTVAVSMFEQNPMTQRPQAPTLASKPELVRPGEYKGGFINKKSLALFVEGKMPFQFQDKPIPEWEKKEEDKEKSGEDGDGLPDDRDLSGPPEGSQQTGPAGEILLAQAAPKAGAAAPAETPPAPATPELPKTETPLEKGAGKKAEITPPLELPLSRPPSPVPPAGPGAGKAKAGKKAGKKAAEKKAPEIAKIDLQPGRVVILSSVDMMKANLMSKLRDYGPNMKFFYNTIESFGLDERLMRIRRKELTPREFKPGTGEVAARWINMINIGLMPLLVGIFGLVWFLLRKAESNRYERQYQDRRNTESPVPEK